MSRIAVRAVLPRLARLVMVALMVCTTIVPSDIPDTIRLRWGNAPPNGSLKGGASLIRAPWRTTGGCCDANHANQKPRPHDTSRIAWAKLMARVGEKFLLECPACGGDIRLISLHQSRGRFGRS